MSARMIPQIGAKSKHISTLGGEFTGPFFDSFCRGSDCDFPPLLCQQTSSCEAYPLRATRAGNQRHSPGKIHGVHFTDSDSTHRVEAQPIQTQATSACSASQKIFVW